MKNADVGDAMERVVKVAPLGEGAVALRAMEVAGHPRVDDVVDVIPLWRAHQVGGSIEVRWWGETGDNLKASGSESHDAGSCFP